MLKGWQYYLRANIYVLIKFGGNHILRLKHTLILFRCAKLKKKRSLMAKLTPYKTKCFYLTSKIVLGDFNGISGPEQLAKICVTVLIGSGNRNTISSLLNFAKSRK